MTVPTAPIVSGVAWFDDRGRPVNAHGGCIVTDGDGRFHLFGEYKTDDRNVFAGVGHYSSSDLARWRFDGLALEPQADGLLGPDRIGERPKVMRCPSTGTYVMFVHADDLGYDDPHIAYAVCDTIGGPYEVRGAVEYRGEPLRRWDVGAFQDDDGTGYLLIHEGDVYRLSDDYTTAVEKVADGIAPGGESPGMIKAAGRYHLLFSNKTSWERNDNYVMSAPSPSGPWRSSGLLAPDGTRTHDSQCGFVFTGAGPDAPAIYLGDRWSFPRQASAATYVWQPLTVDDDGVPRLGPFVPAWQAATGEPSNLLRATRAVAEAKAALRRGESLTTAAFAVPDAGRVALLGSVGPDSGYGRVLVTPAGADADGGVDRGAELGGAGPGGSGGHGGRHGEAGDPAVVATVDFYSAVAGDGIRFISPPLPAGHYRLNVSATGDKPTWSKKDGTRYGATDCLVRTDAVHVLPPSGETAA